MLQTTKQPPSTPLPQSCQWSRMHSKLHQTYTCRVRTHVDGAYLDCNPPCALPSGISKCWNCCIAQLCARAGSFVRVRFCVRARLYVCARASITSVPVGFGLCDVALLRTRPVEGSVLRAVVSIPRSLHACMYIRVSPWGCMDGCVSLHACNVRATDIVTDTATNTANTGIDIYTATGTVTGI